MDNDNIQIYPAKIRLSLNDKATKFLFNQTEENYAKLMNGQQRGVVEKKNHKKHGKITSGYRLQNSEGYTNIAPLDEPARVVLDFCVSEQVNGNDCTTVPIILRGLTGKSTGVNGGTHNGTVNKDQRTMIIQAVDKLMCTQYDPAILQSFDKLNYDGAETVTKAPILPCKRTLKIINGQPPMLFIFSTNHLFIKLPKSKGKF